MGTIAPITTSVGQRDRRRIWWALALGVVLVVALALRLWGVKSGLPYVYDTDEDQHFVPRAIALFGHGLNPNYYANPPAFTYLLAIVFEVWFGGREALSHSFAANPTEVWTIARVTTGVLGTAAVWLIYFVGTRLFDRRTGLLAAALLAVSFVAVAYSKLALNDVPTLVPLELSLWGSAGVLLFGRRRDYLVAGAALGLAVATKYTGGIVCLPLAAACVMRARGGHTERRSAVEYAALAAGAAALAFVVADPYSVLDFGAFKGGILHQAAQSAQESGKLGLTHGSGVVYYLWTITWGLGWVPAVAALGGVVGLWFSGRRGLLMLLVPAIVLYLLFMGVQGRYFGRWLLPVVPLICLLAACGAVRAADLVAGGRRRLGAALVALAFAAVCGQGLLFSIHSGIVNSRADTRTLTRAWLVAHVPVGAYMVIEPVVPDEWNFDIGHPSATISGYHWVNYPALVPARKVHGTLKPGALSTAVTIENYERTLQPGLVGLYERLTRPGPYCWVVTGSTQSGRAYVDPGQVPAALAYYRALARAGGGRPVFEASPYAPNSGGVPFNFDWSFDYYPLAYVRPGPVMAVYHLTGGACARAEPGHSQRRHSAAAVS
jgi:hypothetical protein